MSVIVLRSGRRQELLRIFATGHDNTVLVAGERALVQRRRDGTVVEVALGSPRPAPRGAVDGGIVWDRRSGCYRVTVGRTEYSVELPESVKAASPRLVTDSGIARLSRQALSLGPRA